MSYNPQQSADDFAGRLAGKRQKGESLAKKTENTAQPEGSKKAAGAGTHAGPQTTKVAGKLSEKNRRSEADKKRRGQSLAD